MLLLLHFFLRDDEWWINHQTTKSDDVKHGTIIFLLYRITQIVWYYCVIKYYKMLKPIFLFFYMKPPTRYNLSCLRHADTRQKEFAICLLAAGMTWKDEGRTRLIVSQFPRYRFRLPSKNSRIGYITNTHISIPSLYIGKEDAELRYIDEIWEQQQQQYREAIYK